MCETDINFAEDDNKISLDDFQENLAYRVLEQLEQLGQSGLEVMTSGGKSYIAAYIMQEYVNKHREGKILWLAPKSAIKNVKKKIFSKMTLKGKIIYIGYEELARRNITSEQSICKEFGLENVKLIVFDECHKTMATKTFESIKKIMEELASADRLAMSATPKRYGGINTFDILVPNVTQPITFDLSDAMEHDLLPTVNYILANVNISRNDFNSLTKYKALVQNDVRAQKLYNEVEQAFKNFEFKLERDLSQLLTDYVTSDGSDGERHIAFFSSIEELRNMRSGIEKAFMTSYPKCIINIVEYHSGVNEEENNKALQQFVIDEPVPNRVDVMLSVDKATESIHPDNVRSVMMFRGTQSIRVYLQQMGRGIMLKAYHPEDIVIFDFASNVDCMNGAQSIYIGKTELTERVASNMNYSNTIDEIKRIVMSQFGFKNGIEPKIGLDRLSVCLEKIKKMHSKLEINALRDDINLIIGAYRLFCEEQYGSTNNIYSMINSLKGEINTMSSDKPKHKWEKQEIDDDNPADIIKKTRLYKKYRGDLANQLTVITGMLSAYQKQFLTDNVAINEDVKRLYEAMKHKAYLIADNGPNSQELLNDIDYIKEEIDKHGTIEQSTNNHAKAKLRRLRLASTKNEITYNICCYARRNNVDIEMKTLKISDIDDLCVTQADRDVVGAFKPIMRSLAQLSSDINEEKEIQFEDWLDITAKLLVVRRKCSGYEIKDICTTYIYNKYMNVMTAFKLTQAELEDGAKLLSAICKIDNDELPNRMEEDYIFEHSKASNMSEYELKILKYCGKKPSKYAQEIEENTEFMSTYNKAHNGDTEAIKIMMGYNRELLDTKRKKLLNTTSFKQVKEEVKDTIGPEVLIMKAKLMFDTEGDYKKVRKEISDALVDGSLNDTDIAYTPFREAELDIAKTVLEMTEAEFSEAISQLAIVGTPLNKLVSRCSQYNCCTKDLIHNVVKITALKPSTKQRLKAIYDLI